MLEKERSEAIGLRGVTNKRVRGLLNLMKRVEKAGKMEKLTDLMAELAHKAVVGVEPEELYGVGREFGYKVDISWSNHGKEGRYDVAFWRDQGPEAKERVEFKDGKERYAHNGESGNDPLAWKRMRQVVPQLRDYLQEKLPAYMIPSTIIILDKLPLTANGKLDRKALPRPEGRAAGTGDEMIEPRTPEEELMAGLWRQVLQLKEVGIDDNFFELGGHSLLATQLVSRVREAFGVELALRNLFEAPTIGKLTRRMELVRMDGNSPVPEMVVVDRGEALPLSYAQERLWFLDQLMPGSSAYNIASAVRIRGELAVEVLERAVEELVRRHEVLRTTIEVRKARRCR